MVLLGIDPHKDTHTVVAVDPAGRQLDQTTVAARTLGHGELVGWARMRWGERLWAVEEQVRSDAQDMLRFGGAVKQEFLDGRAELQDQVHIRTLAVDLFISLFTTVDSWADRTLAEIQGWKDLSPDGKNDRGLEIFAQLPVATPSEHTDRTPLPPRTQRRRRSSGSSSTP